MNTRVLRVIRAAASRTPLRRDPAFDDLGDSFWLGGEAQVAPDALRDTRASTSPADDDLDDPDWLVI